SDLRHGRARLASLLDHRALLEDRILTSRTAPSTELVGHSPFSRSPHLAPTWARNRYPSSHRRESSNLSGSVAMRPRPDGYEPWNTASRASEWPCPRMTSSSAR